MAGSPRGDHHRGLSVALALACLACREPSTDSAPRETEPTQAQTGAEPEALELAVAGCSVVVREDGRRCYLGKTGGSLRVLLPGGAGTQLRASLDGEPLESAVLLDARDLVVRIELPGPGQLEIRAPGKRWQASVRRKSAAYYAAYEQGTAAFADEGYGAMRSALAAAKLDADERDLLPCFLAPYAYASDELDALVGELEGHPAPSCVGQVLLPASFRAIYDVPDLEAAHAHIRAARAVGREDFTSFVGALYYEACARLSVGEIDEAIVGLRRVLSLSLALGELEQLGSAQVALAVALARLGRFEEARALADDALALSDDAEYDEIVAEILDNVAWLQLLRREDDPSAPDPSPTLATLVEMYTQLERAPDLARSRLHLALTAVQQGDSTSARATLAQVDQQHLLPLDLVWFELVGARVAVLERRFAAGDAHLERARLYAELHEDPELDWYVLAASAALAREAGRQQQALEAYAAASELASALALSVPGSAGRSMVVTSRSRLDAEHIELLLELDRPREAACVAAGTRARHLRALWARLRPPLPPEVEAEYRALLDRYAERRQEIDAALEQAWSLSKVELEQLRTRLSARGEQANQILDRATNLLEAQAPQWSCEQLMPSDAADALLTMAPSADDSRWTFMLSRADQTKTLQLPFAAGGEPSALMRMALEQLAPQLAGAHSLTVVPVATFVSVDVHALLLARPELSELRVRYSLGLGQVRGRASETPEPSHKRAAVVGGETNLAAVREELDSVTDSLRTRDWELSTHWSPELETQPALLHFAGHGYREGLGGWDSYIELPDYGRLSATKLVAEQRAPALVVLGACSGGSSDGEIIDGGMNLAAAFLLAGAELVIAASGPVDDEAALALARALYQADHPLDADSLNATLGTIQGRELAGKGPPELGRGDASSSSLRWRAWTP